MSDTPRTDALVGDFPFPWSYHMEMLVRHAEQLERELRAIDEHAANYLKSAAAGIGVGPAPKGGVVMMTEATSTTRGEALRALLVEAKQHLAHLDQKDLGAPYYVSRLLEQALRLLPPS